VLWFGAGPERLWIEIGGLERGLRLAAVVGAGALSYFATLFALGFRLRDFRRRGA
jgi:putative peptidoglycan lipid II flippase